MHTENEDIRRPNFNNISIAHQKKCVNLPNFIVLMTKSLYTYTSLQILQLFGRLRATPAHLIITIEPICRYFHIIFFFKKKNQ